MSVDKKVVVHEFITISEILALMFVSQSMFLITDAFLSCYYFVYYLLEVFKYKNKKAEIIEFFFKL